jgi:hypothetical protein
VSDAFTGGVFETLQPEGAGFAECYGGDCRFFAEFTVWDVFGEE